MNSYLPVCAYSLSVKTLCSEIDWQLPRQAELVLVKLESHFTAERIIVREKNTAGLFVPDESHTVFCPEGLRR